MTPQRCNCFMSARYSILSFINQSMCNSLSIAEDPLATRCLVPLGETFVVLIVCVDRFPRLCLICLMMFGKSVTAPGVAFMPVTVGA